MYWLYLVAFTYLDNFKRRLYTKDQTHYNQFAGLGVSKINYYFVNGYWKEYHDKSNN